MNKLKFWPVKNFKALIRFAFMKIFSLAQREMRFGLQNFIIQALRQYMLSCSLFFIYCQWTQTTGDTNNIIIYIYVK